MITELGPIAEVLNQARAAEELGRWDAALETYHQALAQWQAGAPGAELLRKIGLVHYYRGDFDVAQNLFQSSRRVATESDAGLQIASATNCLAIVKQAQGQLDMAEELYATAQKLADELGAVRLSVMIDQNLGTIASIRGDTVAALTRYRAALERYLVLDDDVASARVLNNIGMACVDLERWEEAESTFESALAKAETAPDPETVATVQLNRAELYIKLERFDDARACCDQAFEIFARLESQSGLGETYKAYGVLYRDSGKLHLAEAHLALVAELAQAADHPLLEAEAEGEYALVHLAQGRSKEALKSLNRAHRLFGDLKARLQLSSIDRQLDQLEQRYLQVVQVWGESIESKDRYTAGHCARVADYTCRLAEAVGFKGRDITWI